MQAMLKCRQPPVRFGHSWTSKLRNGVIDRSEPNNSALTDTKSAGHSFPVDLQDDICK